MAKEKADIYFKLGEMHADIKNTYEEAKKTNGRVTKLETDTIPAIKEDLNKVKVSIAKYIGIASAVIWFLSFVIPKIIDKYI